MCLRKVGLADKIQEVSVGMAVNEYGKTLQQMDNVLYAKNAELADALSRSADGHIMMKSELGWKYCRKHDC